MNLRSKLEVIRLKPAASCIGNPLQKRPVAYRCFATARELGLEQGEQVRLLKLAAEHAAETERAARSRAAADAADPAAPPQPRDMGHRNAVRRGAPDGHAAAASVLSAAGHAMAAAAEAQQQDPPNCLDRDNAIGDKMRASPVPAAAGPEPPPTWDGGLHVADAATKQGVTTAAGAVTHAEARSRNGTSDGTEEGPRSSSRVSDGTGGSPAGKVGWFRGLHGRLQADIQVSDLNSRALCNQKLRQVSAETCLMHANG